MSADKPRCQSVSEYGRCGRRQHKGDPIHLVPIGGGSDPISDPECWFAYGRGVVPGYRVSRMMPTHVRGWDDDA